jgi:hypothetical protein
MRLSIVHYNPMIRNCVTWVVEDLVKQNVMEAVEGFSHGSDPAYAWKDWGKPQNFSFRIARFPAEIRTRQLPNASQKRYRSSQLAKCGVKVNIWRNYFSSFQAWRPANERLQNGKKLRHH